jgi:hypothetical protein
LAAALVLPAGCAIFQGDEKSPAWFADRVAELEDKPYPKLIAVPTATPSSRTNTAWAQVQGTVEQAGAALATNPRAAPPSQTATAAAGEFEAAARRETEAPRPER